MDFTTLNVLVKIFLLICVQLLLGNRKFYLEKCVQDVDIDSHYKTLNTSTRKSLEAWSGSQLDLGLVSTLYHTCMPFFFS